MTLGLHASSYIPVYQLVTARQTNGPVHLSLLDIKRIWSWFSTSLNKPGFDFLSEGNKAWPPSLRLQRWLYCNPIHILLVGPLSQSPIITAHRPLPWAAAPPLESLGWGGGMSLGGQTQINGAPGPHSTTGNFICNLQNNKLCRSSSKG